MRGSPYSSRKRAIASLLIAMIGILSCVGFLAHIVSQHEIEEIFSARLATSARVLEGLLARQLEKATIESPLIITLPEAIEGAEVAEEDSLDGHPYESKIAFQVWSAENKLLARSATAPVEPFGPLTRGFFERKSGNEVWQVFSLQSGSVWVVAAEKTEVRDEISDEISLSIVAPLMLGGLLLILVVNWIVLQAMKPVQDLAVTISGRDPLSLEPIYLERPQEELVPVVHQLNILFDRVQQMRSREKRFIDSAAHELRTPIAAIQLHLQNALESSESDERTESLNQALKASRRATRLAEQLLAYSRLTAAVDSVQMVNVSLLQLCQSVVEHMQPILQSRHQTVRVRPTSAGWVYGEIEKLERLIQNLLENASQYGESPGEIEIGVDLAEGRVVLSVENSGTSISADDRDRIFVPYVRLLGSRSSGSGLGLAIVQEIAEQHEAVISVENRNSLGGVRFKVAFKQAPRDS